MHSVSFTNERTGSGVARVIATHNVSVLVQSQSTAQEVQPSIDKLHALISSDPPYSPDSAQRLMMTHGKGLDMAFLSHKEHTLILATGGSGIIFLKRAGTIVELVGDGNAAQGPPERGDEYILTTNEFLDLIGGLEGLSYYFLHYTSAEVVEMMKTYEDQSVVCGFVAIQYGTKHENAPIKPSVETPQQTHSDTVTSVVSEDASIVSTESTQVPIKRNIIDVLRIRLLSFTQMQMFGGKSRRILLLLIPAVLLIFFFSRSVSNVSNNTSRKTDTIDRIQELVSAKLKEADTEAFVNITNVEKTLSDARKILAGVSPRDQQVYADAIAKLTAQINAKEQVVMRISATKPKEYFDLQMIDKDASATDIDYAEGSFSILDSKKGKIYIVDSARRSHQILSSDKYKGATQITSTGRYVYVLTAKDGIYLAEKDRSTQVVKPDAKWGKVTDMKAYTGNIYVLDAQGKNILKYQGVDEKTFGDISPYLVAELQGNLLSNDRLAIDGSVYAAGKESVVKFTTGRKVDFKLLVPHRQIAISAIYTDPDLEQLYLYDTKNQALYSMSKEGIFDRQWIVPGQVIAVAASDKGSKVFAATSRHIYEIENK